jgi:hypothetical protein
MTALSTRSQILIGLALVALMLATRSHHVATLTHLPDASWAVFFLAGLYLRPLWVPAALFMLGFGVDYAAINVGGVSDFCFTPAYGFLIPAYAALWFSGRWYATRHRFTLATLLPLGVSIVLGALTAELLSSGGFYFLSDRFAETSLAGFVPRLVQYFPASLSALAFYLGIAVLVHTAFALTVGTGRNHRLSVR